MYFIKSYFDFQNVRFELRTDVYVSDIEEKKKKKSKRKRIKGQ